MIRLKPELFALLDTPDGLPTALQQAIMLEHATIPTYLYAMFSLGTNNTEIAGLINTVVVEEMLHMGLACNILNAIGGAPVIDQPGFIPTYPGPLPGGVDTGLIVPLAAFSPYLVKSIFMEIEEPEAPLNFPVRDLAAAQLTIGAFYLLIKAQIIAAGESLFQGGSRSPQVTYQTFPDGVNLTAVTDVASACAAIDLIIGQGEGTSTSPLDPEQVLAHYYRFGEIYYGKTLIANPDPPPDAPPDQLYIYGGDPIPFDPSGVLPVMKNPTAAGYPAGSPARVACDAFNQAYTALLQQLHDTFNGDPTQLDTAIGTMYSLNGLANTVMQIEFVPGTNAGPSFEYYVPTL